MQTGGAVGVVGVAREEGTVRFCPGRMHAMVMQGADPENEKGK